jgi:hypothetical protein
MPIDPSIALQIKNPPLESPINQMAKIYEIKQAQQANELNRLKMDEYTRGVQEQEAFKNALRGAGANDEEAIKNAFFSKGDVEGYSKYLKSRGDITKTGVETSDLKAKHGAQMMRDLSRNPSDANVQAHFEDIQQSSLYSPQEKALAQSKLNQVMQMTVEERRAYLASQGATVSELKPSIQSQDIGGSTRMLSIDPFANTSKLVAGSEATKTATPGDVMSATTTRRGQDLVNARDLQKIEIEKGKNSPEFIAMKAKMEQQGKGQAKFEAAAPEAISKADEAIRKIDELVGTEPTKTKEGKIIAGTKPHPGFTSAVGATLLPGARFVDGTSAADFDARLKEIQGGAFLEAYNTLKGGGSITEVEGQKATQAITRMSLAQSEKEFKAAAREFQNILRKGIERSKAKLGNVGAPAAASASPDVDTTNPLLQ